MNKKFFHTTLGIIVLMALSLSYSFGQIGFNNIRFQIPNNSTSTLEAVAIGDVSNDGLNDIVIGANWDNITGKHYIYIYKQLPEGVLAEPIILPFPGFFGYVSGVEIADLNNDGLNDITMLYDYDGIVGVFYQQVDGSFSDIQEYTGVGNWYSSIRCGDLNNDGLIDIIGYNLSDKSYRILYQKPEGGFSLKTIPTTLTDTDAFSPNIIEIGDLNGDGLNDIARIYQNRMEILFQKKDVGIQTDNAIELTHPNLQGSDISKITIGDINSDGKNDIVATFGGNSGLQLGGARVLLFYQTDSGVFNAENAKILYAYDIPVPVFIVDLNCDGDNEIVVGHSGWTAITTYEKSITGEYDSYVIYPSLYYMTTTTMAVGDINGDSRPDVVAVGQNGEISILYNISKPLIFDKIDIKINNISVKPDTTEIIRTVYEPIIDLNSVCPKNDFYKFIITDSLENMHYKGDSLKIRHGFVCSEYYIDSLIIPFDYINTKLLKSDTIKSIINVDKLNAFVFKSNLAADDIENYMYVESNICWNLSCDQDWLQFDNSSGDKDTFIIVTVTPNESEIKRIANIIVTGDNVPPVTIFITQLGTGTNSITEIAVNPDFYINSTTKKLIITKTDLREIVKVRLYDLSGKIVLTENSRNIPTEIDLSSLMQGVYVLTLEFSDRRAEHKILIR